MEIHRWGSRAVGSRFAHSIRNLPYFEEPHFRIGVACIHERLGKALRKTQSDHIRQRWAMPRWKGMRRFESHLWMAIHQSTSAGSSPKRFGRTNSAFVDGSRPKHFVERESLAAAEGVTRLSSYCEESRPSRHYRASPALRHARQM